MEVLVGCLRGLWCLEVWWMVRIGCRYRGNWRISQGLEGVFIEGGLAPPPLRLFLSRELRAEIRSSCSGLQVSPERLLRQERESGVRESSLEKREELENSSRGEEGVSQVSWTGLLSKRGSCPVLECLWRWSGCCGLIIPSWIRFTTV